MSEAERRDRLRIDRLLPPDRPAVPPTWTRVGLVVCIVAAVASWVGVGLVLANADAPSAITALPAVMLPAVVFSAGIVIFANLRRRRR